MDIAVIGPGKFAFQDMACIELALSYRPFGTFNLTPEPQGGEDATLAWSDAAPVRLEVQVKGAAGSAGLAELLTFLAHFPARKSDRPLLQRLMDDPDCHALFILTARCRDELTPLLISGPPLGKPSSRNVPNPLASALRAELAKLASTSLAKPNALKKARLKTLKALAKLPVSDFERALAKTSVVEKETAESIEVRLHATLAAERFDSLTIRGALAHFSDLLSIAKREQTDAIGPILTKLKDIAPRTLRPIGYQDRGIEADLEEQLRHRRVLLLTGPPRAGKSWTTLAVAERLQRGGYEVRTGQFVAEADRFLSDAVVAPRVYVLDDPIGPREPVSDASAQLIALGALCQRIPANRRLIVAQAEPVLYQVRSTSSLAACSVGGCNWLRLEPPAVEVAVAVWRSAAEAQFLPAADIDRVIRLIEGEPDLRDPGALAYLAQTWSELPSNPASQEILYQARRDATDFARSLAAQAPEIRNLLTASALATTQVQGSAVQELAFVINGEDELPGLEAKGRFTTMLDPDEPRPPPPSYGSPYVLSVHQKHDLELLQRRRVVAETGEGLNFTHVYLRAGAQSLVSPDIPADAIAVLAQLRRAIGCASPITSLASARNLWWMRSALRANLKDVFQAAYDGTRSVFPATRDACFKFLIDYSELLPAEIQAAIPGVAEAMVVDFEVLDTTQGVGFITDRYDFFAESPSLSAVGPYLLAIETGAPLGLDLSLARRILAALQDYPVALTELVLRRFLLADEAMVRAAAAKLWIAQARDGDDEILSRLAADQTPAMTVALFEGLAYHWDELPGSRRGKLLAVLASHATSPSCASVLFTRLVLLNRKEKYGDTPPWQIFTTLMPDVILNLPLSVSFRNGRLNSAVDDAIPAVPTGAVSPLLQAWGNRLLKRIGKAFLDEYELCIVEPLLDGTSVELRLPIFKALLATEDTGARAVTVRWLLNGWHYLQPEERAWLESAIVQHRADQRWLLATVLTRAKPPAELVALAARNEDVLTMSASQMEVELGSSLFEACVHMHAGCPQPLWWYALHHSSPQWHRVIRELADNPAHPMHPVAFYEIAKREAGELKGLVARLPDGVLWETFLRLLDIKVSTVADWNRPVWLLLLGRLQGLGELERCLAKIDAVLEGILENGNDLVAWLGKGEFASKVVLLLPNDQQAIAWLKNIRSVYQQLQDQSALDPKVVPMQPEIMEAAFDAVLKQVLATPPRLFGTWDLLRNESKAMGCSESWYATLDAGRSQALERHSDLRRRASGSPREFKLPGWIDANADEQFEVESNED